MLYSREMFENKTTELTLKIFFSDHTENDIFINYFLVLNRIKFLKKSTMSFKMH